MNKTTRSILVITLVATALRVAGAFDDFWLDEVFTYYLAMESASSWDVLTGQRLEHHILNTLYMHLVGERDGWFWYRFLSLITGSAAVFLSGLAWVREDPPAAVAAAVLAGFSYPLILYSSEARGYAPALFFCLAAFLLQKAYFRKGSFALLPLLWASIALALLANLSAVFVFAALVAWALLHTPLRMNGPGGAVLETLRIHAVPAAFAALLFGAVVSRWESVGGDIIPLGEVLSQSFALATGLSAFDAPLWGSAAVFAAVMTCGLVGARRDPEKVPVFFLAALVIAPTVIVALAGRDHMYPRYFIGLLPLFFLLAARGVSLLWRHGRFRIVAVALMGFFVVTNLYATGRFITTGRGNYSAAVRYMADHTAGKNIYIASNHDFRNEFLVQYYQRLMPAGRRLVYIRDTTRPPFAPNWYIRYEGKQDFEPREGLLTRWGTYLLEKHFPFYGPSGSHWILYRHETGAGTLPAGQGSS